MKNVQKKQISSFIRQLWAIVEEDEQNLPFIRWNHTGLSFVIESQQDFSKKVLQKYFSRNPKFTSFVRQLNMYNFKKIKNNYNKLQWEHNLFKKYHKQLLVGIKRKPTEWQLQEQRKLVEKVQRQVKEKLDFSRKMLTPARSSEDLKIISHQIQKQILPTQIPSNLKLQSLQGSFVSICQQNQSMTENYKTTDFKQINIPQGSLPFNHQLSSSNLIIGIKNQGSNPLYSHELISSNYQRLWIPTPYFMNLTEPYWPIFHIILLK